MCGGGGGRGGDNKGFVGTEQGRREGMQVPGLVGRLSSI